MRTGISFSVTSADLAPLAPGQGPQRSPEARLAGAIVLLSAEELGTNAIMRETSKPKTCVWRGKERFVAEESMAFCATRPAPRASRTRALGRRTDR